LHRLFHLSLRVVFSASQSAFCLTLPSSLVLTEVILPFPLASPTVFPRPEGTLLTHCLAFLPVSGTNRVTRNSDTSPRSFLCRPSGFFFCAYSCYRSESVKVTKPRDVFRCASPSLFHLWLFRSRTDHRIATAGLLLRRCLRLGFLSVKTLTSIVARTCELVSPAFSRGYCLALPCTLRLVPTPFPLLRAHLHPLRR